MDEKIYQEKFNLFFEQNKDKLLNIIHKNKDNTEVPYDLIMKYMINFINNNYFEDEEYQDNLTIEIFLYYFNKNDYINFCQEWFNYDFNYKQSIIIYSSILQENNKQFINFILQNHHYHIKENVLKTLLKKYKRNI